MRKERKRRTLAEDAGAASRGMGLAIGEMLAGLFREELARRIAAGEPLRQAGGGRRSNTEEKA